MQTSNAQETARVRPILAAAQASQRVDLSAAQYRLGVIAILIGAAILRMWNLASTDMWTDEYLTSLRANVPWSQASDSILSAGNQLPLYFVIMRLLPNDTQFMLRLPSVVLGITSILLFIVGVRYFYTNRTLALQAGTLLAINPLHIMLSRTARFYTLLLVLSLAATFLFILILRGDQRRRVWVAFTLTSMTLYFTHYTAFALPAVQLLVLAIYWRRHRAALVPWGITQALASLPAAIWLLTAVQQYESGDFLYRALPPTLIDLPLSALNILMGTLGQAGGLLLPAVIIGLLGLGAGFVNAFQRAVQRDPHSSEALFWGILALLPPLVLFAVSVTLTPKYKDRYLFVTMPAVLLLFLWGWRHLARQWMPFAFAIVCVTSAALTIDLFQAGADERTEWSNTAAYIEKHWQPGDILLFSRATTLEAFSLYFEGDPAILSDHTQLLSEVPDPAVLDTDSARIWVIYRVQFEDFHTQNWVADFDPFRPGVSPLSDWLIPRQDRIQHRAEFRGVLIFLLAGATSAPPP